MRTMIFENAANIHDLTARLIDRRVTDPSAALERIRELNPHLDLKRVKAGSVLILPETPGIKKTGSDSIGGFALERFAQSALDGITAFGGRIRETEANMGAQQKAVEGALRSQVAKQEIDGNPALRKQLEEAGADLSQRRKAIDQAKEGIDLIVKSFGEELGALKKLLS